MANFKLSLDQPGLVNALQVAIFRLIELASFTVGVPPSELLCARE